MIDDARRLHGDGTFNRMYAESLEGMLDLQRGGCRRQPPSFVLQSRHHAPHLIAEVMDGLASCTLQCCMR